MIDLLTLKDIDSTTVERSNKFPICTKESENPKTRCFHLDLEETISLLTSRTVNAPTKDYIEKLFRDTAKMLKVKEDASDLICACACNHSQHAASIKHDIYMKSWQPTGDKSFLETSRFEYMQGDYRHQHVLQAKITVHEIKQRLGGDYIVTDLKLVSIATKHYPY